MTICYTKNLPRPPTQGRGMSRSNVGWGLVGGEGRAVLGLPRAAQPPTPVRGRREPPESPVHLDPPLGIWSHLPKVTPGSATESHWKQSLRTQTCL